MRVLFVSERWFPTVGGGEYHIDSLTRELARKGIESVILTRDLTVGGAGARPGRETIHGGMTEVVRLPFRGEFSSTPLRLSFPAVCTARGLSIARECDIIHGQSILAGLPVRWLSALSGRPSVYTVHGFWYGRWAELTGSRAAANIYQDMERFITFQRFDRTITVDMQMIRTARALGKDVTRTVYIPNGVDLDRFSGKGEPREGSLLFVGRLVRQKGVSNLIRAMALARRRGVGVSLDIVGDGELEGRLKEEVRSLNLEDAVTFHGKVDEKTLRELYRTGSVFVLPSMWEGLPLTLLEAWSASMPVITTAVGGIPDVATNEKDSLMVASGDVEGLGEAIIRLVRDRELARRLGESGRRLVEREYTWERCAERTADLYRDVIAEAKR